MKTAALVLGILASFLALPTALCSGACAQMLTSDGGTQQDLNAAGGAFLVIGLIAAVVAFASAILVMVRTRVGAWGLAAAFGLTVITCMSLNPFAFLVALLLFVGMLLAFFAARDEANAASAPQQLANPYGAAQYGANPYGGPPAGSPYGAPPAGGYPPPQQGGGYGPPQGGGYGGPPQGGYGGGYGPQGGTPPQNPWQ